MMSLDGRTLPQASGKWFIFGDWAVNSGGRGRSWGAWWYGGSN